MSDFILFAILGIGAGAVYALLGLGIVLIQKGTGAVNFSQGTIAGVSAIYFAVATNEGTPVIQAFITAVLTAAVGGVVFYWLVMRPLREAPLLARVVSTLGLMVLLQGLAGKIWPSPSVIAPPLFPTDSIQVFGIAFGADRLYLFGVVIILATGLWGVYRFTTFGRATRATAESERGAMLLGYSPDLIGAANWAAGSALAALAGVLIAPVATLDINTLSLLVLPALAAALVGKFSSFGVTTIIAMVIGIVQSLLTNYWQQPGVNQAFPFLIVIAAMVFAGTLIPERGSLSTRRLPLAMDKAFRPVPWGILVALLLGGLIFLNDAYKGAITTSLIFIMIALSLIVVSGFVGQISLAQMAFAGVGGFAVAKFAALSAVPFPIPILLGALIAVPIGVMIGLPALRVRGINLAVLTLGASVAISAAVFQNSEWTGGASGSPVPSPELFGLSIDAVAHPMRYGIFCLVMVGIGVVAVSCLRRSPSGRRMLAVRSNERASAVIGINVSQTKLVAFALSSFLAASGGGLLAYQLGAVAFDRFSPMASIMLVAIVYIGGIATVNGAIFAGLITTGGIVYAVLNHIPGVGDWWIIFSGAVLLITVVTQPSGAAVALDEAVTAVRAKFKTTTHTAVPTTATRNHSKLEGKVYVEQD